MLWSYFSFFTLLFFLLFNSIFIGSPVVSGGDALPIRCEYPCQPAPPGRVPLYGTPPPPSPPSEPVYKSPPPPPPPPSPPPPPPVLPSCPPPPMPTSPVYGVPPPPPPPMPTSPVYGVPPGPPSIQGTCPPMQNCVYPSPNADIYQPLSSASHLPIHFLYNLVLMFLLFLPF